MKKILQISAFSLSIFLCLPSLMASELPVTLPSLKVLWSTDVDGRQPADVLSFARPIVMGQGEKARIVIGGADARVHIYNMKGDELFRLPIQQNSDSGAGVLSSGLVVLGDSQGRLYGVDAKQGQIIWHVNLSSSVTGVPVAVGQDVVVQTTDNNLYRINAKGEKIWSFASQQGGLSLYISSSPMLHQGVLYALLSNGDAVAINAKTGDLIWRKQLLLDTNAAMLNHLKAPKATPLWLSNISFDGRVLQDVVLFSFYQGKTFVLNRADGSTMLSQNLSLKSSPVLLDGILYSVDTTGVLRAMKQSDGQEMWKKTLSDHEWMGPVIWHHVLWLSSDHGKLLKVSLSGELLAVLNMGGSVERLPLATSKGLLLHNTLGGLYLVHE